MNREFAAVDEFDASGCIAFLDFASSMPEVHRLKRESLELLRLRPGDSALDVGCGTGGEVSALAALVGPTGRAVGIDSSHRMIETARERHGGCAGAEFLQGNVYSLPFGDGSFDAVRVDRVLHFLEDPMAALREMVRVLAPNGRLLASEPYFSTLSVRGGDPELTARIMAGEPADGPSSASSLPRLLPAMLSEMGLQEVEENMVNAVSHDLRMCTVLYDLVGIARDAFQSKRILAAESIKWLRSLQLAWNSGRFECSMQCTLVLGTKAAEVA